MSFLAQLSVDESSAKVIQMIASSPQIFPQQIKEIRLTGYELTTPISITIPVQTPVTSIFSSFFSLVSNSSNKKKVFNSKESKKVTILSDKLLLVTQSNKLVVFYYSVIDDKIQVVDRGAYLMDQPILKLACSDGQRFDQIDNCNYALLQQQNFTLSLFAIYDYSQAVHLYQTKCTQQILAAKFIAEREVLIVRQDGVMVLYLVRNKKLVEHEVLRIKNKEGEQIRSVDIAMFTDIPETVYVFFTSKAQKKGHHHSVFPSLHMLEFAYHKTILTLSKVYSDIFSHSVTLDMLRELVVYAFRGSFFIQNEKSLWMVQYKFGTYTRADAITNINNIYKMRVIERHNHLFLCTFGQKQIQLCQIHLKDVGCKAMLLDVIQSDQADTLAQQQLVSWIFKGGNKTELAFLLDQDNRTMKLYLTRKKDKLNKLVERVDKVQSSRGNDIFDKRRIKAKVHQIESLSERLGFNRKELYLSLWHKNEKNAANISQYLIPCNDFSVIIHEFENYLRLKELTLTQIVTLLKIIQKEILKKLTVDLDLDLIHKYLKCNFQRRKLKLYNSDKKMDFAQYKKINEMGLIDFIRYSIDLTLFPQKFYHHILWKQQKIDTPLEVHYILREFRLIILEDYPGFLIELLEPYWQCLLKVLSSYYYLLPQYPLKITIVRQELVKLSNIYPASQIAEMQHFWLGYITELEWISQQSSLNYLFEHLYDHYDTSLIQDKLKQFCRGGHYQIGMNKDVLLVGSRRDEFQRKLPVIGQATLLLELCEKVNRRAIEMNKQSQNQDILNLMMGKNKLPYHQYTTYLRLSRLQKLLLRNQLIDPSTTMIQLMDISPVRLVGLFFLGERAKIDILFNAFSELYESYDEFTSILKDFVESQECSKVELQILVDYLRQLPEDKIASNMDVLSILIEGFLARIELRQMDKAKDFHHFFCDLPLKDELLIKLSIFDSIKTNCYPILRQLGLGKLTYLTIINNIDYVMQLLVNNYFNKVYENKTGIYIEGMEVNMTHPQNLFAVVLYLKDKIYSFRPEIECYLSFAYWLVTWNQFSLIIDCFGSGLVIDGQEMLADDFYLILVKHVLDGYISQTEMIYDSQTNEHLMDLFQLLEENEPLRVSQIAKIQLSQILGSLGYDVTLQYMQVIRQRWSSGRQERIVTFTEIIDNFVETVSFKTFKEMFQLLETIRLCRVSDESKNQEFIELTLYICKCLATREQYYPLCEIIAILNQGQTTYKADESIMTECFLKVLSQYQSQQKKDIQTCRKIIDFFLTYYCNVSIITDMYAQKITDIQMEEQECRQFVVDQKVVKVIDSIKLSRKTLWEYVNEWLGSKEESVVNISRMSGKSKSIKSAKSYHMTSVRSVPFRQNSNRQIIYCYFFISRMLQCSDSLLNLDNVSFAHDKNASMFIHLSKLQNLASQLDLPGLIVKYMKGLYKLYYTSQIKQKRKMATFDQNEGLVQEIQEMERNAKEIDKFSQEKLFIMVYQMNKDSSNEKIFLPLRKLANLLKSQNQKAVDEIGRALVNFKTSSIKAQSPTVDLQAITPLFKHMEINYLSQSVASNYEPRYKYKLHNYSQFQYLKQKYALKTNITSQRRLAQKIILDLKEGDEKYEHMFVNHDESLNSSLEMLMLDDFKLDQEINEASILQIVSEIEQEKKERVDQTSEGEEHSELKQLLEGKVYEQVLQKYSRKDIIKAIDAYFYNVFNLVQKDHSSSKNRRIKRAQSLNKSLDVSEHKIFNLIQIIDNLGINGSNKKHKYLKKSLAFLAQEDLINLEANIFMVFKLDILLNPSENPKRVLGKLLQHMTQLKHLELDSFEKLVQVIDSFYFRSFEHMSSIVRGREDNHYVALMYLVHIQKLMDSNKSQEQKSEQLEKIMLLIGRQGLTEIHDGLLRALDNHEQVLEKYIVAIYRNYGGIAAVA